MKEEKNEDDVEFETLKRKIRRVMVAFMIVGLSGSTYAQLVWHSGYSAVKFLALFSSAFAIFIAPDQFVEGYQNPAGKRFLIFVGIFLIALFIFVSWRLSNMPGP